MQSEILSEWYSSPVTEWLLRELKVRQEALTDRLVNEAGRDPIRDARDSGAIMVIKDIFDIDFEGGSN